MREPFTTLIVKQMNVTFCNLQIALSTARLEDEFSDVPLWRIFCHILTELDSRFTVSDVTKRMPGFLRADMCDLSVPYQGKPLSKDQLVEYYSDVKARVFLYLNELDDDKLLQRPILHAPTRLEEILREQQTLSCQIGRINAFTELSLHKKPVFIEREEDYPTDHNFFETL